MHIRPPRIDYESHVAHLDRTELGATLVTAGLGSARDHACCRCNDRGRRSLDRHATYIVATFIAGAVR